MAKRGASGDQGKKLTNCMTVSHLQKLAKCANFELGSAASHALAIVLDIREHGVKGFDIYLLRNLLDELYAESGESLFAHLRDGAPDCDLCAAVWAFSEERL